MQAPYKLTEIDHNPTWSVVLNKKKVIWHIMLYVNASKRKVLKMTDGRTDGQTSPYQSDDGHNTIIRPVRWRAYKNYKKCHKLTLNPLFWHQRVATSCHLQVPWHWEGELENYHTINYPLQRQKGGDLTQSYDKSPYTHGNVKRGSDNTNNATKKFD